MKTGKNQNCARKCPNHNRLLDPNGDYTKAPPDATGTIPRPLSKEQPRLAAAGNRRGPWSPDGDGVANRTWRNSRKMPGASRHGPRAAFRATLSFSGK